MLYRFGLSCFVVSVLAAITLGAAWGQSYEPGPACTVLGTCQLRFKPAQQNEDANASNNGAGTKFNDEDEAERLVEICYDLLVNEESKYARQHAKYMRCMLSNLSSRAPASARQSMIERLQKDEAAAAADPDALIPGDN